MTRSIDRSGGGTVVVLNDQGKRVHIPESEVPAYKAAHGDTEYTRALWLRGLDYETHRRLIRHSARHEGGSRAGIAAAQKLDAERDIDLLRYLAVNDPNPTVRGIAVGRLSYPRNRRLLRYVVEHDGDFEGLDHPVPDFVPRSIAMGKLSPRFDLDLIQEGLQDGRWQVRHASLETLDSVANRALIEKVAKESTDKSLRELAARILNGAKVTPGPKGQQG